MPKKYLIWIGLVSVVVSSFTWKYSPPVFAATPSDFGLKEGDLVSAIFSDDPDVYIINEHGYKRLFLNPEIFKFYSHLGGFASVKLVTPEVRDAFPTVALFRNCETPSTSSRQVGDPKVYGFESEGEDQGKLRWVNTSGDQAVQDDPDFFKKVFCINDKEFKWYKRGEELKSVKEVLQYHRATPAVPAIPATPTSVSHPFAPAASISLSTIPVTPASGSLPLTPASASVSQSATPAVPATPAQPAGSTPTPTPTLTSSPSPSPTASVSATPTPTPVSTPSTSSEPASSLQATPTPTANPTLSYIPISMVQMIYPNGGESFEVGKTYTIRWSSQNIPSGSINHFQLSIYSVRPGLLDEVHLAIGSSSIPPDQTSYSWTVPNVSSFDSVKDPPTTSYKMVVYAFDNNNRTSNIRISSDYSDKAFTITSAGATPIPTPIPTPTVENCTDYDGLDPYTYGRLTYTQQNGYVNEAFDVCSSAEVSILLERACLGFDGFSNYVEYLCPNGCSNGVCNSALISQNSFNNFAVFSRNLTLGSAGDDVKQLQALLVSEVGYSADLITGYFGRITRDAVKKLQEKYGVKPVSGYFGGITRRALNAVISSQ